MAHDASALDDWIREETAGSACVVDFGAGFFDKLAYVPISARKIGIEVCPAYMRYAPPGVFAVLADIKDWEQYVKPDDRDTAMLIDTIEHLPKDEGIALLEDLKAHFSRILVMTPDGFHPQDGDLTGYENEYQIHVCGYEPDELRAYGFTVSVIEGFHADKGNALFAVWRRE